MKKDEENHQKQAAIIQNKAEGVQQKYFKKKLEIPHSADFVWRTLQQDNIDKNDFDPSFSKMIECRNWD